MASQKQQAIVELILSLEGDQKAIKDAETALNRVRQAGQAAQKPVVKTTLASQNVIRIIQDMPYGMMGITNNIQAMGDSLGYLKNQGVGFGEAMKQSMKGLLMGPMAISLVITLVSVLAQNWDKVSGFMKDAGYNLGILNKQQKEYNEQTQEGYENTLKLAIANKTVAELEGDLSNLTKTQEQLTDEYRDARFGTEGFKRSLVEAMPIFEKAARARDRVFGFNRGATEDMVDEINRVSDAVDAFGEEIARQEGAEWMKQFLEDMDIAFREAEKKGKKFTKTIEDFEAMRVKLMFDGREKRLAEMRLERDQRMTELKEFRDNGIITERQYQEARTMIMKQFISQRIELAHVELEAMRLFDMNFQERNEANFEAVKDRVKRQLEEMKIAAADAERIISAIEKRETSREELRQNAMQDSIQIMSNFSMASQNMYRAWEQHREAELDATNKTEEEKSEIMKKEGAARFGIMKALMIAETLAQTFSAAQSIYNSIAASSAVLGPAAVPLAAAGAASAMASGLARVAAIRSLQPGSSSAGGGSKGSAPTGRYTQLNSGIISDRVVGFETTRAGESKIQSNNFEKAVARFEQAAANMTVVLEDRTSERVVKKAQSRMEMYGQ